MPIDEEAESAPPWLLSVGLAANQHRTDWNYVEVTNSVHSVSASLAPYGFVDHDWSAPGTTATLRDQLVNLGHTDDDTDAGIRSTLLYWCGHGQLTDREFFLITNDATGASATGGALSARDIGRLLYEEEKRRLTYPNPAWRIVIIDTCDSGIGIAEMAEAFPNASPRGTLLVASAAQGAARAGEFGAHLASVFENEFINQTSPIRVLELKRRIEDWLRDSNLIRGTVDWNATIPAPNTAIPTVTTSMDVLAELKDLPPEVVRLFSPSSDDPRPPSRSAAEITSLPWQFVGRMTERARITRWLGDDDGGMLVVVGMTGSGKSAMLGAVLAATIPELLTEMRKRRPRAWPDEVVPQGVHFETVSQLAGQSVPDFVASLVSALHLEPTDDVGDLIAQLTTRGTGLTLLVDALNESSDPIGIAGALRELSRMPNARVLVGTERFVHAAEPPSTPVDLLPLLGGPPVCEIGIDPHAAEAFVADQLGARLPEEHARAWADEVALHHEPFLFARLAVQEALANPSEDPRGRLGQGHRGLFALAFERITKTSPRTGALLRVLALAHGRGFPRNDGIWAVAASAVAGDAILDPDVEVALKQAAPYVLVDHQFGQAAFRLANQAFADFFQADPSIADAQDAVTRRLLQESRSLKPVPEYLRRYLPEHLAASSVSAQVNVPDLFRAAPGPRAAKPSPDVTVTEQLSRIPQAALTATNEDPHAAPARGEPGHGDPLDSPRKRNSAPATIILVLVIAMIVVGTVWFISSRQGTTKLPPAVVTVSTTPASETSLEETPSESPTSTVLPTRTPITESPTFQEPTSQEPTSQEPTSQEPTSQEPTSQEPTSQEPIIQ